MTDDLIQHEDVTRSYGARREDMRGRAALEALLQDTEALPPGGEAGPPLPLQQDQSGSGGGSTWRTVRDVATDIGTGIVEAPAQILNGMREAAVEAGQTAASTAEGISDAMPGWLRSIWFAGSPFGGLSDEDKATIESAAGRPFGEIVDEANAELGSLLPGLHEPRSVTGGMVNDVSQFVTGFVAGGRVLKALKPATTAAKVGKAAGQGAVSDAAFFDAMDGRLADLVESYPELRNPVTGFLKSDPNDKEAEARTKRALDGLMAGTVVNGFMTSLKALRSTGRQAMGRDPLAAPRAQYGTVTAQDFTPLGDPAAPAISRATSGEVKINFAAIDTEEDVANLMKRMADARASEITEAQRGVISFDETKALADDLGMSVEDLLSRRQGQPFNAEQALAARRLWTASGEKLLELAKRAHGPGASQTDMFLFRKMLATHYAIQASVLGARTETARALNAWKIPAGGGVDQARAIQNVLAGNGGTRAAEDLAARLSILAEAGASPGAINQYVRKGWGAKTFEAVREVWVNGLLSAPQTHVVNMTSNTSVLLQSVYERAAAARLSSLFGRAPGEGVAPGEAAIMMYGLVTGLKDAFRLGATALRTGETGASLGKIDLPHTKAVHGDFLRESGYNGAASAVDFIGEAFRVPGRLLGAEDEFFKAIGYRMEVHAQALRQGVSEGLHGAQLTDRVRQIVSDPPEHIRIAAADAALYNTFTNQTGNFGKAMLAMRESAPVTSFILPFLKTPINIARYAFERSPIAPLVGQWRADIAAGGARADIARARMATGTAIMLLAADYAQAGFITGNGPDDQGEREALMRQGWRPYSLRIGDKYVEYNRLDPFGMTVGFAADMAELVQRKDIEPEEMDEVMEVFAAGTAAVARVSVHKTYMQGIADFISAVDDPERYATSYLNSLAGSFVPAGAAAVERGFDPIARQTELTSDYLKARIAGLSERLPPRRDLWGRPITSASGLGTAFDLLAPVRVSKEAPNPIDAEIQRLNLNVLRPRKTTSFNGVDVDLSEYPAIFDEYARLAGNDLKDPAFGLGAMDYLNAVVSGKHPMSAVYQSLSEGQDGGKAAFIFDTVNRYRELTRRSILADPRHAAFAEQVDGLRMQFR